MPDYRSARRTTLDPIPSARDIRRVDKENVCGQHVPLEERNVERVFEPQMKQYAKR
jgi:hypothetical protein